MNDPNKNKKPSRWQELAEDLGLIEASEPAKSSSVEPATATPPRREEAAEHRPEPARPAPEPPIVVTTVVEEVEVIFEPADEAGEAAESLEAPSLESESSPDTVLEDEGAGAPGGEGGGSSRSSSRRRRRRRSSKKKKDGTTPEAGEAAEPAEGQESPESQSEAELEPVAAAETAEKPAEEKPNDRERGRGRGRGGRRRREPEPEVVDEAAHDEDEVHESGGNVGLDEDDSDEEPVNYSNWTVPAWKDLIASLYRPDR
jgi:hypothetical protein